MVVREGEVLCFFHMDACLEKLINAFFLVLFLF